MDTHGEVNKHITKEAAKLSFAKDELIVTLEEIDPINADLRLLTREAQRNVSHHTVNKFAQMMPKKWVNFAGEPIVHNKRGELIDGQHRLLAVVKTGATVKCLVKYGSDDAELHAMGTGKPRNFSDLLTIHGEKNTSGVAAIVRAEFEWRIKTPRLQTHSGAAQRKDHYSDMFNLLDLYYSDKTRFQEASNMAQRARRVLKLPAASWGVLFYRFLTVDHDDAWDFMYCTRDGEKDGVPLTVSDPCRRLRECIFADMAKRLGERRFKIYGYALGMVIKAWNAYRQGREIQELRFTPGGSKKERFPEIDGLDIDD